MRAGLTETLEKFLRRPDTSARLMIEAQVHRQEVTIQDRDGFEGADSLTGLQVLDDGVRLAGTVAIKLENIVSDGFHTDLDRTTPFDVSRVEWGNANPEDLEVFRFRAFLDPANGGVKDVVTWRAQMFAMVDTTGGITEATASFQLVPLHAPIDVTAGVSAAVVTFQPPDGTNIRPMLHGRPGDGGAHGYPFATTFLFIWAINVTGGAAINVGWGKDSAQTSKTTGFNTMTSRRIRLLETGRYAQNVLIDLHRVSYDTQTFTSAIITFTNGFDLPNAITGSNEVEFIGRSEIPFGTSVVYEVRNDADTAWVVFKDGQTSADLAGVTARTTPYSIRASLNTDAGGEVTPILRQLGVREIESLDLSDIAEVDGPSSGFDPITGRGEIGEARLRAVRDGVPDFRDLITELLSENDIGDITFRLWVGIDGLAKDEWLHIDDLFVDDVRGIGGGFEVLLVSPLAKARQAIPPFDPATDERKAVVFANATQKSVYNNLIASKMGLEERWIGPGVENTIAADNLTKTIEDSDAKAELDAVAYLAGGAVISSQGRLKFVDLHGEKGTILIFDEGEISPTLVTPGWRQRIPEWFVKFNINPATKEFDEARFFHAAAITKLGTGQLDAPRNLEDIIAEWIPGSALATKIGQRQTNAFGTGLISINIESAYMWPELEPGDRVGIPVDTFVARDPNSGTALKGILYALAVIRRTLSWDGRAFEAWVRSYADIVASTETVTPRDLFIPEILSIATARSSGGDVSATVQTVRAKAIKIAGDNSDFPTKATVQAALAIPTDSDGTATTGSLVTLLEGETGYVSALAYAKADGTGRESLLLFKARSIEDSNHELIATAIDDGWSPSQNAAAPEINDVLLITDLDEAFSNLEDANGRTTAFKLQFHVDTVSMDADNVVDVVFFSNNTPTSTTWIERQRLPFGQGVNDDQETTLTLAMAADWDFRVQIQYLNPPGLNTATVTMNGETNARPGIQFTVPALKTIGDRYVLPVGVDLWATT